MDTHNGVKGTWKDVTGDCEISLNSGFGEDEGMHNIFIRHGSFPDIRMIVGTGHEPWAAQNGCTGLRNSGWRNYRIVELGNRGSISCGSFRIEHFEPAPEPEYGWVDVTEGCVVNWNCQSEGLGNVVVSHCGRNPLSFGGRPHIIPDQREYRVILGHDSYLCGHFAVEHWQELCD